MHAQGKLDRIGAVGWFALFLGVLAACGPKPAQRPAPAFQPEASPAPSPHADAVPTPAPAEVAVHEAAPPPPQTVSVESAEADEIRVHTLTTISLEAAEIVAPKQERTRSNPTPKELGWGRLQGHLIQAEQLVAHSVRARRVVAEEIYARTIGPLKGPLAWSPAPSAGGVVNECVSALDGGASSECFKERPF